MVSFLVIFENDRDNLALPYQNKNVKLGWNEQRLSFIWDCYFFNDLFIFKTTSNSELQISGYIIRITLIK